MKKVFTLIFSFAILSFSAQDINVVGFDGETHTGGSTITKTIDFPSDNSGYQSIIMNIGLTCPAGGCDPWDRFSQLSVIDDNGAAMEIGRYATPYGNGDCTWTLDVTDYRALLTGSTELISHIETYANGWNIHTSFDFIEGTPDYEHVQVTQFFQDNQFTYGDTLFYSINLPDFNFEVPSNTEEVVFRVINSGHGQGNTNNAAEFSQKTHQIRINGQDEFEQFLWKPDCNINPCSPQAGTWQFARAGWCPGQAIEPWDYNITSMTNPGETVNLDYVLEPFFNICSPANPTCTASDCSGPSCLYNDNTHTTPHYKIVLQVITKSSTPLSVQEFGLQALDIEVFPVPSQDVLNIRLNRASEVEITVLDITGKAVILDQMNSLAHQIDLSNQAPGIYLLQLRSGDSFLTERFSISR